MTAEQIYKTNKRRSNILGRIAPIMFYIFLIISILFITLTVQNSLSNLNEISDLLDGDVYTDTQLSDNYSHLITKYGEWRVAGKTGSLITFRTIDYRKAIFAGLSVTYFIIAIIAFCVAIIVGKILFPSLSKMYKNANDELVDISALRTAETVNEMAGKESKNKKPKKEWF